MHIAAYVRVSTDDQNEQRQMLAIRQKYSEKDSNQIDWFCDLGESGASTSRRKYQRLREHNFSSEGTDAYYSRLNFCGKDITHPCKLAG